MTTALFQPYMHVYTYVICIRLHAIRVHIRPLTGSRGDSRNPDSKIFFIFIPFKIQVFHTLGLYGSVVFDKSRPLWSWSHDQSVGSLRCHLQAC